MMRMMTPHPIRSSCIYMRRFVLVVLADVLLGLEINDKAIPQ